MGRTATAPGEHTPHRHQYPAPYGIPMGVSLKQGKPPHLRGLLSSLAPGKKSAFSSF